jgi:putative Mg2+ transporter-C (MgtC) family protein
MALAEWEIALRLVLGFAAGGVIGFERSSRHQVAGLRTHILICLGSTLVMVLSVWLPSEFQPALSVDPGRIAAQVVSGIGFLGAGAIIRLGNNVKGLTTAASLWLVSAVGLAVGAGFYLAAGLAVGLSLFALVALDRLERRLFPSERNKLLELTYRGEPPDAKLAVAALAGFGVRVQSIDLDQAMGKHEESKLRLLVGMPDGADLAAVVRALEEAGRVERIELKEKY